MKNKVLTICISILTASIAIANTDANQKTISFNKDSKVVIRINQNPDITEDFAARELADYLRRITGAAVFVRKQDTKEKFDLTISLGVIELNSYYSAT